MTIQQDEQNLRVLKEAFPGTDSEVIEAVLEAQNNNLENAFESLLSISDPKAPSSTPAVQEQMRLDEEYAKQLAQQETSQQQPQYEPLHLQPQYQQPLYQQQQQQQHNNNGDPGFNFQEELPIIKERMIEAGNAAKKKVLDLYNHFKQRNNNSQDQYNHYNHISPTNAHYRGLPGDDDLLTGDISAPYLSDYDVYTHTRQTPDKADEELARKLSNVPPPPMPPRKNTVGSSVEFDGDLYNDTGIKEKKTQESSSVPYVIGDDDSDSEDEKRPTLKSII